ncbi:TonB-dependent receptor [Alteromonas pelagimontana]|uniref:TonB-dependent receptor n=1 Tax=Alteromonas pelagimontana TaxID=1858656 RepID=A0A6M4MFI5_9ALTE|nr:TonB-dependent receptor [Alteromonas pelagimontana]QJR81914.1 TonB-dependent receptor [Alteromonas pelagimontana]
MFNFKRNIFTRTVTAIAVAAAMGGVAPALAQSTSGAVSGQVVGSSEQAVADAEVTILNVETGFTRTVEVDSEGNYRFPALPIGRYVVTAKAPGYAQSKSQEFSINAGGSRQLTVGLATDIERIEVSGTSISMIDISSSGTALNIGEVEIDRLPVARNATAVALLAPSTVAGDGRFGNLASFGGSSVAENAVYINGLNVTNFRTGTGFSDVPFEFYKQFEVKTGGYSAEFGRSTGGVINAITKSGTNEFKFGANVYYQPESLREQSPDTYLSNGNAYVVNRLDERSEMEGNIYASGPLIEDTLFFYAIYNPRDISREGTTGEGSSFFDESSDDAFYGGKIDWQINDDHLLELLAFSDSNTLTTGNYRLDLASGEKTYQSTGYEENGGDNWSVKYTGYLTDTLTVTAMYGENKYALTSRSNVQNECNFVYDLRDDAPLGTFAGCIGSPAYLTEEGEDKREAMRIDFEWYLGDHLVRFGYDTETNTSEALEGYSGPDGKFVYLRDGEAGGQLDNGAVIPAGVTEYVEERVRTVEGSFETENSAFYIEDIWSVTDRLTATIGLRNDAFDNKNGAGETFVKIDNMWAPRLGISYDINGDGESKVYANVGRYFLPVASNTNVRMSGNEFDVTQYFPLLGTAIADFNGSEYLTYEKGSQIGPDRVNADGSVPDTRSFVDQDLDPMYQDEFILGYEAVFAENWSWGIRGIRRELNGAIDDMEVSGYLDDTYGCHAASYILGNPGKIATLFADTDCSGDGSVDEAIEVDLAEIGYPEGERKYNAVELTLARVWDGQWSFNASYSWSQSYGNTEGLVKSDNAQDDAGITQDFDFPELMDGAYGYLPNDRRHVFKAYGAYALTDDLTLGANFTLASGRPTNAFGIGHPNGVPAYGDTFYICTANCTDEELEAEYAKFSRGTYGRTEWTPTLDLNLTYNLEVYGSAVVLRADVYNVLDAASIQRRNEFAEDSFPGDTNERFMAATAYQTPRYVQFSAGIEF